MSKTYLLTDNGVSMFYNEDTGTYEALVNGDFYNVTTYRPVNGDGRMLKEVNRTIINGLKDRAFCVYEGLAAERYEALEKAKKAGFDGGVKSNEKSFSQILEEKFIETLSEKSTEQILDVVSPKVEAALIKKFGGVSVMHRFEVPERPAWETSEVLHKDFDNILKILLCGEAVYMYGEAGTGKSYIARQAANALGVDFYASACVTDEVTIKGYSDAHGNYHETPFYQAFKNGGVFLLDELDASIPDVLVMLNDALANGEFSFPNGEHVKKAETFYCLATGNTLGTGSDMVYTGRCQLDGATLDRFAFVHVIYDKHISLNMANGDKTLCDFSFAYRAALKKCGVNALFTYRSIKRLAKFSAFMSKADALRLGLLKGMSAEDVRIIADNIERESEWKNALYECASESEAF